MGRLIATANEGTSGDAKYLAEDVQPPAEPGPGSSQLWINRDANSERREEP